MHLLEFDGSRRLLGDCISFQQSQQNATSETKRGKGGITIIYNPTNSIHLIHNPSSNPPQKLSIEIEPISRHVIRSFDGPQGNDLVVDPLISHDAHRTNGEQSSVRLGNLAVEPGSSDFFDEDVVRLARDCDLGGGDFAEDANCDSGAGERVTPDEFFCET